MAPKTKKRKSKKPPKAPTPLPPAENENSNDEDMSEENADDEPKELSGANEQQGAETSDEEGATDGNKPQADNMDEKDVQSTKPKKKRKKGIIYVSNIPKHMNVTRIREILGEFGKIGRVYLQPEKMPSGADKKKKKKRKRLSRHFTEGWVEFESKRVAKQIVPLLNNKQISSRKKSHFYDHIWSMKYLPRFKWVHLTERMNYEQAVHKQRLVTEVSQARKETTFFQTNLDRSDYIKKKAENMNKKAERSKSDA